MHRTLPYATFSFTSIVGLVSLGPLAASAQEVVLETPPEGPIAVATDPQAPDTAAVIVIELVPVDPPPTTVEATHYVASTSAPGPGPQPLVAEERVDDAAVAERPFSIGLSGLIGFRDGVDGLETTWTAGLDLSYRVAPWARIAIRRVTFGWAATSQGDRYAIGASPALDLSVPLGDVVEPFAELGLGVQARLGGRSPSFGLAPFVAAGARFHVSDRFALGAEAALTVPATEHVLIGHELFPRASILVQLGASIEASF
ncbi:MAG: hypothetical protein J0L92_32015 [Deltaproteobacteria bacterium]|nr:hypothetical protein [Deltaproteobacteria bacterium]